MQRSRPVILQGMEPGLADRGPGRIIFLNGASTCVPQVRIGFVTRSGVSLQVRVAGLVTGN
jgi:hypothetical protein